VRPLLTVRDRGRHLPRLRRLQLRLDNLESAVNLALVTRYAEIASETPREPRALVLV
jgi:hypothetical protein